MVQKKKNSPINFLIVPYQKKKEEKKNNTTDSLYPMVQKTVLQISCTFWFKKQCHQFLVPYDPKISTTNFLNLIKNSTTDFWYLMVQNTVLHISGTL